MDLQARGRTTHRLRELVEQSKHRVGSKCLPVDSVRSQRRLERALTTGQGPWAPSWSRGTSEGLSKKRRGPCWNLYASEDDPPNKMSCVECERRKNWSGQTAEVEVWFVYPLLRVPLSSGACPCICQFLSVFCRAASSFMAERILLGSASIVYKIHNRYLFSELCRTLNWHTAYFIFYGSSQMLVSQLLTYNRALRQ